MLRIYTKIFSSLSSKSKGQAIPLNVFLPVLRIIDELLHGNFGLESLDVSVLLSLAYLES